MSDNFTTGPYYRDPSGPAEVREELENPESMLMGLKAAQQELSDYSPVEENWQGQEAPGPADDPAQNFERKFQEYSERIENEKSKLEEMRAYLEASQNKLAERLQRLSQLQDAVEKTRKNIATIHAEISAAEDADEEILGQIKQKLSKRQRENEYRDHNSQSNLL